MRRPDMAAESRAAEQNGLPGLWPAAAITALAGIVCWVWLSFGAATETAPAAGEAVVSELAQVDDLDVAAALTTMSGSDAFLSRFKKRVSDCPQPLAWVTLARAPGQPSGTVRLRSGSYFSPVFSLSAVPMRVAIPYPGPYESGRGKLTAMDAGGNAAIALVPAWRVSTQDGGATRDVVWTPRNHCVA